MSIHSILWEHPPDTPPDSRNPSFGDDHAAQAPHVPPPDLTTPENDPALPAMDAEVFTAGMQLCSMKTRSDADDDQEVVNQPLNAARNDSSTGEGPGNGNGKDPELYDTNPGGNGNTSDRHVDLSTTYDTAESLLQVRYVENELDSVSALLALGADPYECKNCPGDTGTLCPDCSQVPWHQRVLPPPPPVANKVPDNHLYSSDDEGPPLSTARKISFNTCCHGNDFRHSAHEGNAVFALPPLSSQRKRRSRRAAHDLERHSGETKCRRCRLVQEVVQTRYVESYKKQGCKRFKRQDTQPLDDDAVDDPRRGRYGAAAYDDDKYSSGEMSSKIPKLGQETLERLEMEKWQWKSDPDPFAIQPSDAPVSPTDATNPIRLPLYAEASTIRGSLNPSAGVVAETTAEQTAPNAPPPSSHRPSYTDPRSGATYPRASAFINLTSTISSPSPSTRQARKKPPITPSPLKHVENAASTPEPHTPPTTSTTSNRRRDPASGRRDNRRLTTPSSRHRAELTNEFIRVGLPLPAPRPTEGQRGSGAPASSSTTGKAKAAARGRKRKRKAAEVEGQGAKPKVKRRKGKRGAVAVAVAVVGGDAAGADAGGEAGTEDKGSQEEKGKAEGEEEAEKEKGEQEADKAKSDEEAEKGKSEHEAENARPRTNVAKRARTR